ncbi:hypothetical protein [Streptomyces venezuelae]|uniref:hypothetical protein n=1 Tax=Streptomyces venezuelae TaxID=54571 RepID=UPI0034275287
MTSPKTRTALVLAGLATTGLLTACTSNSPTTYTTRTAHPTNLTAQDPADVYRQALTANADAGSLRQRVDSPGRHSDLRISATECAGTITHDREGQFDLTVIGTQAWARADTRAAASVGHRVPANRWIHANTTHPLMRTLAGYCHLEQFTNTVRLTPDLDQGPAIAGTPDSAVLISRDSPTTRYFITATSGRPRLLAIRSADGETTRNSDFGTPINAHPPHPAHRAPRW